MQNEPKVKIIVIKDWCDQYLSPMAWTRLVIRNMSTLKESGFTFEELKDPTKSTKINKAAYKILLESVEGIYGADQLMAFRDHIKNLIQKHSVEVNSSVDAIPTLA
jgi:hypothetical protein